MSRNYQASFASKGNLQIPSVQIASYGKNVFVYLIINGINGMISWNDIQKDVKGVMLNTFSIVKIKSLLIEFFLNMYIVS